MSSLCLTRLQQERKNWRKDHPFGFWAKPKKGADGALNLMEWSVGIPGKVNTDWEGGIYPVTVRFSQEYPSKPPKCQFPAGFYHPNVYPSGTVCLSILNESEDWRPALSVKQICLGIQELLDTPNPKSPAQMDAYTEYMRNKDKYARRVKEQARQYTD